MQENLIQVAIPVPMRQLFTYKLPNNVTLKEVKIGQRVIVPFSHRTVVGVVYSLGVDQTIESNKLKAIISLCNDDEVIPPPLLKLLQVCADYYHYPIGEVLQLSLPVLLRQIDKTEVMPVLYWKASAQRDESTLNKLEKKAVKQHQLYQLIAQQQLTKSEIHALGFTSAQIKALENKALIQSFEHQQTPYCWADGLNADDKHALTAEQAVSVAAINQSIDQYSCHLIDGVTGSGKTEVYLQAMEKVIANNQQVLILVPEIGLTPQTLARFEQRFNVPIFLHHSALNDKERFVTWQQAHQGKAAIVIGTRSAIFCPLQKLGLIIVDEEHDASFKQQDTFRYHGRDVAILRAKQLGIPIVLGSATPSFETLHNAKIGKYHLHKLTQRAGNSVQSEISLINVADQHLEFGLSEKLKQKMTQTLNRGEQVLVFINRRGYAPAINCQECHWVADCHRCNKPYTFHKNQQLLICHHCAGQKRIHTQCPQCGSVRLKPIGHGTEQIEQHLAELFPKYSTIRIDRDSTRRKGALAKVLQQVADKEHHILVGTQMLAKGHHFPDVTLVAILDADGPLFSFDYRAAEHMAQLLVQVAGRAGRASKPGKVLIQTQYPEHPLLQDLVHNGYQHFAEQALQERRYANLPPFGYQVLIRAEANYPSYPEKFLRQLTLLTTPDCEMAGPMPAPIEKRAGKYRFQLLVQSKQRVSLHHTINQIIEAIAVNEWQNKVRWSIDIDPIDLS